LRRLKASRAAPEPQDRAGSHSLDKAKARYPWAKAWILERGGIWCFEDVREARTYQPETFHELFTESERRKR
jgi:hypothetical protein